MKIPSISLYNDLWDDVFIYSSDDITTVNSCVRDECSVDYPNVRISIKDFFDSLPVYTLSDLGITSSNINATFTTKVYSDCVLVNLQTESNIVNSKLFCMVDYTTNSNFSGVVWLKNNYI